MKSGAFASGSVRPQREQGELRPVHQAAVSLIYVISAPQS